MIFNDLNLTKKDSYFLIILFCFSVMLIYKLVCFYLSGGIYSPDKGAYLANALNFAGLDFYHISDPGEIYLSPTISFFTSILFRIGYIDYSAILIVTGIFGLLGNIGLYLLLRYKFNSLLSLTGSIIYGSLSIILLNLASGLLDVPAVSVSIWIILFTVLAVNNNLKYYIVILPLFVVGFFTRYTVGFILPLILLYYVNTHDIICKIDNLFSDIQKFKMDLVNYFTSLEFKYIIISIILSIVLMIVYLKTIHDLGSTLGFIQQSHSSFVGSRANPMSVDYSDNHLFYLINLSNILFSENRHFDLTLVYLLYSIFGFGLIFKLINIIRNQSFKFNKINYFKTKYFNSFLKLIFILSLFGCIYGIFIEKQIIANCFIIFLFIILFGILKQYDIDENDTLLLILNISWFSIYFIYFSFYDIKTYRYIMPIIPSFIYFIVYSLDYILYCFRVLFENKKYNLNFLNFIPIIIIIVLMISSINYVDEMKTSEEFNDLKNVTEYLIDFDDDYHSKTIFTYPSHIRIIKWYLNNYATPIFEEDVYFLDSINADYIIYDKELHLQNYKEVYNKGKFYLYSRDI